VREIGSGAARFPIRLSSIFAPFSFWKEKEMSVKKGEKAVYIFAPYLKKEGSSSETVEIKIRKK
jgi:hypothetical protein